MAEPTKAELMQKLKEAEELIKAQEVELDQKQKKIESLDAQGKGWLVMTKNPKYDGRTLGIQFVRGQAFLPDSMKVPAVRTEPMKESTMDKYKIPADERKAIRERERLSDAEKAAKQLRDDFGYTIQYFDGTKTDDEEMEKIVQQRAKEYAKALELDAARQKAQEIMSPHYMGQ